MDTISFWVWRSLYDMSYARYTDIKGSCASISFSFGVFFMTSPCTSWLSSTTRIGLILASWPSVFLYRPSLVIVLGSVLTPTAVRSSTTNSFSFFCLSTCVSSVRSGALYKIIFFCVPLYHFLHSTDLGMPALRPVRYTRAWVPACFVVLAVAPFTNMV